MKDCSLRPAALGIAAAMLFALTGCAPKTPQELVERAAKEVQKTPVTGAQVAMDLDMTVSVMGIEMTADATIEANVEHSLDPLATHTTMTLSMEMLGMSIPMEMETYEVVEDNNTVTYSGSDDKWTRTEDTGDTEESEDSTWNYEGSLDNLAFDEEATEWNGTEVRTLVATLTGEEVQDAMADLLGEDVDIDWSAFTAESRFYFDAETYLPVGEELALDGSAPMEMEGMEAGVGSLSMGPCTMTVTYTYDEVAAITVPEEVRTSATAAA